MMMMHGNQIARQCLKKIFQEVILSQKPVLKLATTKHVSILNYLKKNRYIFCLMFLSRHVFVEFGINLLVKTKHSI